MSAERLLAHYERTADAPDAIARLRQFILGLVVRGKLVKQNTNDEPLENFDRGVPAGIQRPFEIPRSWSWARLHTLGTLKGGGTPSKAREEFWNGRIPWISPKDMKIDYIAEGQMSITEAAIAGSAANLIETGSILFVVRGMILAHSFPVAVSRASVAINQDMKALVLEKPEMAEFILRALKGLKPEILKRVQRSSHGTCRLEGSDYSDLLIPIPPLDEQHRIVAKVDELMGLCDRQEAARAGREAVRDRLAAASLARLNAPDPETFQSDARFALNALPALTTRPDQIKALRQTILNLAVRGKLVPQDQNDEPGSELLNRIAKEIPTSKAGNPKVQSLPYGAPRGWAWTHLGRLVAHSDAGWSPKTHDFPRSGDEWGVLKVSAVSWDKFRPFENKQVLAGTKPRLEAEVKQGDFLISRANTAELVARAVLVDESPSKLMMSDKIVRLRLSANCSHRFVWLVNNYADFARNHYVRHASGVSPSMKNVSRDVILSLPFPLPPLTEQNRIVAKVDILMALCNRLEASLTAAAATRRRLLDALLADALAPREFRELEAAD